MPDVGPIQQRGLLKSHDCKIANPLPAQSKTH